MKTLLETRKRRTEGFARRKKAQPELTYESIRERLHYDPEAGEFTWIKSADPVRHKIGRKAGSAINSHGYRTLSINYKKYTVHRLAWLWMTGVWPDQVDHINGNRQDNRWCNLRSVDALTNIHNQRRASKNSKSGALGVYQVHGRGKYIAHIRVEGKRKVLGRFETCEEASAAYRKAKLQLHKNVPTETP